MVRKVPVFLEPTKDRKIAVFGGGMVAYRKCKQFEGFHITVIADRTVPDMENVCDDIILAHFDPSNLDKYLKGVFIAVAATDSKTLNAAITETAKKHGCLVNSAHGGGDILLPSSVRKENYTVAVSSEGSVPAFPPYVARMIDGFLGPEYDLMMELLKTLRQDLPQRVSQQPRRAEFLAEVLENKEIWDALKDGNTDKALGLSRSIEAKYKDQ